MSSDVPTPPDSYDERGKRVGRLVRQSADEILPDTGQYADVGGSYNGRKRINYATEATVEPLTRDHLGMVEECYEASLVPGMVITDMAKAARSEIGKTGSIVLQEDEYNWPFGKTGGMLNRFSVRPDTWIPDGGPMCSIQEMMDVGLARADMLKKAGAPVRYEREGWLTDNGGRFGTGNLFDSVYEGEVLLMDGKIIAWFTWWRSQFKNALDERRNQQYDWSVADMYALFDLRYKKSNFPRHIKLNEGESPSAYLDAAPRILRTDTANARPEYPGAAGFLFDRNIPRLVDEYGYDLAHAWRIFNVEIYNGYCNIGKKIYSMGRNDLSGSFLDPRMFDPKGTRLSDELAHRSGERVLAVEEHRIGVKERMLPKMAANQRRYESDAD